MLLTALLILAQPVAEPRVDVGSCAIPTVAFQRSIADFIGARLAHARPLRWQFICRPSRPVLCGWVDAGDGRGWRPFWVTPVRNVPRVERGDVLRTDSPAGRERFRRLCTTAGYRDFEPPPPLAR